jgi:hypothetical protein
MIARLGKRKNFPREELIDELNMKISEKERGSFIPWFLESTFEVVVAAQDQVVELPADFLREVEGGVLELTAASGQFLYPKKRPHEAVMSVWQVYPNGGIPDIYSIFDGKIHLAPRPIYQYELVLPYYAKSPEVQDNDEDVTGWLEHAFNYIVYDTLVDVSSNNLKDEASAARFKVRADAAFVELFKYNESRQHVNADYNIGDM